MSSPAGPDASAVPVVPVVPVVTGALAAASLVAVPVVAGRAVAAASGPGSATWPTLLLVGLVALAAVLTAAQRGVQARAAESLVRGVRDELSARLLRADVTRLAELGPGPAVTAVTEDAAALRQGVRGGLPRAVSGGVLLVGSLVVVAVHDVPALLATVGALLLVGVSAHLLLPRLRRAVDTETAAVADLGRDLAAAVAAARTVKVSRAEAHEHARLVSRSGVASSAGGRTGRLEAVAASVAGAGSLLGSALVLVAAGSRVASGALAVDGLVVVLLAAVLAVRAAADVGQGLAQRRSGAAASSRLAALRALPVEDDAAPGEPSEPPSPDGPVVSLRDVSVRYADDAPDALSGVSLDVPRVGHTAIVGPSGAGKTTLLSLVLALLQPRSGHLFMDGVPYQQLSTQDVRRRIAYVEQDAPLVPGTLRDNLSYVRRDADDAALWEALRAVQLADRVAGWRDGLDTELDAAVVSGGERQRIAIARALVSEPDVLLLDEVTAQLDGLTEYAVQDAVARIATRGAVLTVAHRLSTVVDADRILVLEDSRLRAQGTHDELVASDELYQALVVALRIGPLDGPGVRRRRAGRHQRD